MSKAFIEIIESTSMVSQREFVVFSSETAESFIRVITIMAIHIISISI